mmetsp:Transcript_1726/g.4423  ORF Transcript_1726/g.4423 Transcript_1726/m.4423 type:complete len:265 (+) Transcript_1726:10551-11345(+)
MPKPRAATVSDKSTSSNGSHARTSWSLLSIKATPPASDNADEKDAMDMPALPPKPKLTKRSIRLRSPKSRKWSTSAAPHRPSPTVNGSVTGMSSPNSSSLTSFSRLMSRSAAMDIAEEKDAIDTPTPPAAKSKSVRRSANSRSGSKAKRPSAGVGYPWPKVSIPSRPPRETADVKEAIDSPCNSAKAKSAFRTSPGMPIGLARDDGKVASSASRVVTLGSKVAGPNSVNESPETKLAPSDATPSKRKKPRASRENSPAGMVSSP